MQHTSKKEKTMTNLQKMQLATATTKKEAQAEKVLNLFAWLAVVVLLIIAAVLIGA